ncbi:MAG: hypothetical protein ACJAT5_000215, partial [Lentimonas sp.]
GRRVPAPHECSNPLANTPQVRTETVLPRDLSLSKRLYLNPFKPFKNWYEFMENNEGQISN